MPDQKNMITLSHDPRMGTDKLIAEELRGFPSLPQGYLYDANRDILDLQELAKLMNDAGNVFSDSVTTNELAWIDYSFSIQGISRRGVGIRTAHGLLVGYGLMLHRGNHAEFNNLAVDPAHRRRNLGRAIIDARLECAKRRGIGNICVAALSSTNTLKSYYLHRGFRETGSGSLGMGQDPTTMEELLLRELDVYPTDR